MWLKKSVLKTKAEEQPLSMDLDGKENKGCIIVINHICYPNFSQPTADVIEPSQRLSEYFLTYWTPLTLNRSLVFADVWTWTPPSTPSPMTRFYACLSLLSASVALPCTILMRQWHSSSFSSDGRPLPLWMRQRRRGEV